MKVKYFTDILIRPAANGVIVDKYNPSSNTTSNNSDVMVFNDFGEFIDYIRNEIVDLHEVDGVLKT